MIVALLVVLLVVLLAVPLLGFGVWAVSTVVVGLVIGALGRLVVPGTQPIGCLATLVAGLAGSVIGTAIGRGEDLGHLVTVLIEIGTAAVLVAVMSRSRVLGRGGGGPRATGSGGTGRLGSGGRGW